jgi:enamine deaminase RidA (YjgF/YER057c/UK114 family)
MIERINPAELVRPSGYSHATVATGRIVFLAGQTALDSSGKIVDGTIVEQFEQALRNLLTALAAAGGAPSDLASLTIYATDIPDYQVRAAAIGEVWRRLAGRDYPAMALIGVDRLWDLSAMVEIQGFAVLSVG